MPIIGTTGTSGTNAYFRISTGGSVPFGATAVGGSGTFARSMAPNIYPPFTSGVPSAMASAPWYVDVNNASTWSPRPAIAARWDISVIPPGQWGTTAGNTGGFNPSNPQGVSGEVTIGSGTTALFFNQIGFDTFSGTNGEFSNPGWPAHKRGTMISLTNTNAISGAGAVIYFRANGLPVWLQDPSTSRYYVRVPVAHVSGTWSAITGNPITVELDAPAQFSWHGTPGGNKVWAGPDEINRLIIAHPVPTLGGSAVIGATGTQTQPLPAGVTATTPDAPSGGVGFWGVSRYQPPSGDNIYVGNMLTGAGATAGDHSSNDVQGAAEAFKALCATIAGQSAGYFVTPGQAQNYVEINGWWTNYSGTGASDQNRP